MEALARLKWTRQEVVQVLGTNGFVGHFIEHGALVLEMVAYAV